MTRNVSFANVVPEGKLNPQAKEGEPGGQGGSGPDNSQEEEGRPHPESYLSQRSISAIMAEGVGSSEKQCPHRSPAPATALLIGTVLPCINLSIWHVQVMCVHHPL
jgi:hypothetical protein